MISPPFKTHTIFLYCNFINTKLQIKIVTDTSSYDIFDTLEALAGKIQNACIDLNVCKDFQHLEHAAT